MDLYDIAVARKLSGGSGGGGGGVTVEELNVTDNGTYTAPTGKAYSPVKVNVSGGGSSDFSTAQVTVVNNTSDPISSIYVCVYDAPFSATVAGNVFSTGSVDYNVPLYKGVCYWAITDNSVNVSVSGDVEWDSESGGLLITGDCTITIS